MLRHWISKIWKWLPNANQVLAFVTVALAVIAFFALRDSQNTAQHQLRAYIYVNPQSAFHIDGQGTLQVYSIVGNSGQTPALNVERFLGLEVLPPIPSVTNKPMPREEGVTVLGPRNEITLVKNWSQGTLSADQFSQIRDGSLRVYVFGMITYEDIYEAKWQTNFCNAYFGPEGVENSQPTVTDPKNASCGYLGWQAKPCETGNQIIKRN
jgi:hypothetical protein